MKTFCHFASLINIYVGPRESDSEVREQYLQQGGRELFQAATF